MIEALQTLLAALPPHIELQIVHNPHRSCDQSAEHYLNGEAKGFANKEAYDQAITANDMWELHWYPRTSIGCITLYAPTLPALFEHLAASMAE